MSTQWHGLIVLASAVVLLTGCSGQDGYELLDQPRTAQDEIPGIDQLDTEGYDLESSRYSGSHEGADFFLIRSEGSAFPCLVRVFDGEPMIGCGGRGEVTIEARDRTPAQLVPAPARDGDGWVAISENVRVEG